MQTVIYDKTGKYSGYLGNVMFQTAATISIAIKNNMNYLFPHKHYFDYFVGKIPTANCISIQTTDYTEPNYHYDEVVLNNGQNHNLNGYFQSWRYFEHCKELIHEIFTFNDNVLQATKNKYKHILNLKSKGYSLCFIHVRRGDFALYPDNHPMLTMQYYNIAMKALTKFVHSKICFLIISNDIAWCKQNFTENIPFYFIEGNQQDVDMCLMANHCDHGIMANSTMGWWGAQLIKNKNKIIFAPKKWFGPAYSHWDTKDLYRPEWILI